MPALSDGQFARWQQLLEARTGIDLSQHPAILQSGLNRCLRELGGDSVDHLYERVSRWPEGLPEWHAVIDRLVVRETRFFRQPAAFDLVLGFLEERLKTAPGAALDLWSAGCADGEEACSLAMVASEAVAGAAERSYLGVLGSDISTSALARARSGHYSDRQVAAVPDALRARYLAADAPGQWRLQPALAARMCWTWSNLLDTGIAVQRQPAMDVIFCQNVLIYFRRWRVRQVLDMLVQRLKPGGLLVLGPGEVNHWRHPALISRTTCGVNAWVRLQEKGRAA